MTVDDVVAVCPGSQADTVLKDFDDKYRSVVNTLGLDCKPDDPDGFK